MDQGSPTSNMENEEGEAIKANRPEVTLAPDGSMELSNQIDNNTFSIKGG